MLLKVTMFSAFTLLFAGCADTTWDYQDTAENDTGFYESDSYDSPEHYEQDKQDSLQYLIEGEPEYTSGEPTYEDAVFQEDNPLGDTVSEDPLDRMNP